MLRRNSLLLDFAHYLKGKGLNGDLHCTVTGSPRCVSTALRAARSGLMAVEGTICQIYWHKKQPIYSVDFERVPANENASSLQNTNSLLKFATAGADCNIRIWSLDTLAGADAKIDYISTLSKHIKGVNVVRFSPSVCDLLCSAGDAGALFVWQRVDCTSAAPKSSALALLDHELDDELSFSKETWKVKLSLENSNPFDIYAAEWSSDSRLIAAGSSDDTVRIYSLKEGRCVRVIKDHAHFVNGISWDPLGCYLASCSSDRSIKISKYAFSAAKSSSEMKLASPGKIYRYSPKGSSESDCFRLFCDETLMSFFRRGAFSPSGSHFLAPAGLTADGSFCVHVFVRSAFDSFVLPSASVGGFDKPAIGVFFCPVPLLPLPPSDGSQSPSGSCFFYIYSVLTLDSVYIFESSSHRLLFSLKSFHYSTLTDASWSRDGRRLLVTSNDGFVSCYVVDIPKIALNLGAEISICKKASGCGSAANSIHENSDNTSHSFTKPVDDQDCSSTSKTSSPNVFVSIFPSKKRITPLLINNLLNQ